jgi:hypothetical protein
MKKASWLQWDLTAERQIEKEILRGSKSKLYDPLHPVKDDGRSHLTGFVGH